VRDALKSGFKHVDAFASLSKVLNWGKEFLFSRKKNAFKVSIIHGRQIGLKTLLSVKPEHKNGVLLLLVMLIIKILTQMTV
jgi:hypothetical protein